jgi:hypothetical protein
LRRALRPLNLMGKIMRNPGMRAALILAPFLLASAAAQAEPLMVTKGQWSVTQDIYYDATASGQPIDLPPEHSTIDECWSLDEEVLIDESMVEMFEGCRSTGAATEPFGLDIGLACNFDGIDMGGGVLFSVSHDKNSFVAQVDLASVSADPVDFKTHILMIGHRTGTCKAPS